MNRIEYVSTINFNSTTSPDSNDKSIISGIIKYFDESMGLYNVVGDKSFAKINACENKDLSVSFNIELASKQDTDVLQSIIESNRMISIYGRTFEAGSFRLSDNTISIKMSPVNQINYASPL